LVEPVEGLKVLDVGIGTALLSKELSDQGCSVYGVDFSPKMLEKARLKIPDGKFETVDLTRDHFGRFNHEKFDRVISAYFFHHLTLDQKTRFFELTIENNLKAGGKIIIGDIGFKSMKEFEEARLKFNDHWDDDEYYLCGEEIKTVLSQKEIETRYRQISSCGGILYYE
jgi:putative AdoMet-dependent methyltransferase